MSFFTRVGGRRVDRFFLICALLLIGVGVLIFSSASLGLLAKSNTIFKSVTSSQLVEGLLLGLAAMYVFSRIHYQFWRKISFYFFSAVYLLNLAVFLPGRGLVHGGATRWIDLGFTTFQPSEFLKVAFVLYLATLLVSIKNRIKNWRGGFLVFCLISGLTAAVLLAQRDTDALFVIIGAGSIMYLTAGGRLRHLFLVGVVATIGLFFLVWSRPYIMDRLATFIDPSSDPKGAGYQIQQSLIAVGSGGLFGRGFGQSVQKFKYLPEPVGDSIFSVAAEEFGFVGSVTLIILFLIFAMRGLRISARAPDLYGGLLAVGFTTMIVLQSFMNIAAMIGLIPLSGMPLIFISHGGTALMTAMAEVGIILNVSRYRRG
jgi:cell division protein FtsW